jgi:flagellar hook assembly protein FlgD
MILIELSRRAIVEATVYDVNGRLVKELWDGSLPQGTSSLEWNGVSEGGVFVASGVYFLKIQSRGFSETTKLVVLR